MKFLNVAKVLALLPLTLALTQCDRIEALLKPKSEKPGLYAFDLILKMSPKAEAALKQSHDELVVVAFYYGHATPAYRGEADTLGRIYLGREQWSYPGNVGRVHLDGDPLDASSLSKTTEGQPMVLVSVKGGGDPDHPGVSCHDFIGPIRLAQQKTPVLNCEYGPERYWESADQTSAQ